MVWKRLIERLKGGKAKKPKLELQILPKSTPEERSRHQFRLASIKELSRASRHAGEKARVALRKIESRLSRGLEISNDKKFNSGLSELISGVRENKEAIRIWAGHKHNMGELKRKLTRMSVDQLLRSGYREELMEIFRDGPERHAAENIDIERVEALDEKHIRQLISEIEEKRKGMANLVSEHLELFKD
ncbi:MAG: hypothetical protein AABW99_03720 [archaeon]